MTSLRPPVHDDRLSVGPGFVWRIYGRETAALYLTNRGLLRRDAGGWWYLGHGGVRVGLEASELLFLADTAPSGWHTLAEQEPILNARQMMLEALDVTEVAA